MWMDGSQLKDALVEKFDVVHQPELFWLYKTYVDRGE